MNLSAGYKNQHIIPMSVIVLTSILYFMPYFVLGENAIFPVIDNMDCYYVWNKIAALPQYAFAPPGSIIQEYMNGLPKFTLLNGISVYYVLNLFLPCFYATVAHIILVHFLAATGMYFLSKKYVTPASTTASIIAGLLYGFQNFIYAYSLSFSLLPLVIISFVRFYKGENNYRDWILICVYPFLSNLQSVGIFVLGAWLMATTVLTIKSRKNLSLFFPAIIMTALYYCNNYPTINNLLFKSYFISHRSDFKYINDSTNFVHSAGRGNTIIALLFQLKLFIIGGMAVAGMYIQKKKERHLLMLLLAITILFELEPFLLYNGFVDFLKAKFEVLKMYHFDKVFVFKTIFQVMVYAISFSYFLLLIQNKLINIGFAVIIIMYTLTLPIHWKPILGKEWSLVGRSFKGYYSPDLFDSIKRTINMPVQDYRVASFGIHPAAALYNGLYTVDGYINNYPISYKQQFRAVIAKDIDSIHMLYGYKEWDFETTGHRCYLQTKDIVEEKGPEMPIDKLNPINTIVTPQWNINALKTLHCQYIISSVALKMPKEDVTFLKDFENQYYHLYLYKIL